MKRGVKPRPIALRLLEGREIRRKPTRVYEILPRCPAPPVWMTVEERRHWRKVVAVLWRLGTLTAADLPALEAYCSTYCKWRTLREKAKAGVIETKSGYVMVNPLIGAELKYLHVLRLLMAEFGMTPSSRVRVDASSSASDQAGDPLLELVQDEREA